MDPNDTFSGEGDVLTQNDIERLLSQVSEQESTTEIVGSGGSKGKFTRDSIQPYDFRQPVFLSAGELRKLRLRQEDFTRSLAARLSIYLRLDFLLQMSRLQTLTYQKFVEMLQNPTHLTLFKAEPLRGVCVLDIPPQLGVTIVDRLLGGTAHQINLERDLSDIEAALLDQAVQIILNEWCNQWANLRELRPVVLGHETNARFLQTSSHDTVMLVLALEAKIGDCQDTIQMGFPCYMLEPLMRQLSASIDGNSKDPNAINAGNIRWNDALDDVSVQVTAEWTGLEMSARQLTRLQVGDVLQLDGDFANQVRICLADTPKFSGRLGSVDKKWAVELTHAIKNGASS
jgi:flagellar motor switch protein FliM